MELAEIVQLHGGGKVQQHVREVGTFVGQFVEHCVGDQFDGKFDVSVTIIMMIDDFITKLLGTLKMVQTEY